MTRRNVGVLVYYLPNLSWLPCLHNNRKDVPLSLFLNPHNKRAFHIITSFTFFLPCISYSWQQTRLFYIFPPTLVAGNWSIYRSILLVSNPQAPHHHCTTYTVWRIAYISQYYNCRNRRSPGNLSAPTIQPSKSQ